MKPFRIPVKAGENGIPSSYRFTCQFDMDAAQINFDHLVKENEELKERVTKLEFVVNKLLTLIEQQAIQNGAN